jgi:hypothetical protein
MIASVLSKNVPSDASEEEKLRVVLQNIVDYSVRHGFNHRQIWRIFDAGLAAQHVLTAPTDGYDSAFKLAN